MRMLSRLGLVARIAIIVTAALGAIELVTIIVYGWALTAPQHNFTMAQRIIPIVHLLDKAGPAERDLIVTAATANGLPVIVLPAVPADFNDVADHHSVRQDLTTELQEQGLLQRTLLVGRSASDEQSIVSIGSTIDDMRVLVGLSSGEIADFRLEDAVTIRIRGLPIGLIAGVFGIVVAILAISAVARETRPLSELARSVDSLGNRVHPVPLRENGARELKSLIRSINRMQDRIAGLVNNRTLILGAISHDLKTYLTRLRLRLEVMPDNKYRDQAVADVVNMQTLIEDTLIFAKASFTKTDVRIVDVNAVVSQCVQLYSDDDNAVTLKPCTAAMQVRIGDQALHRVIMNVVDNALRYGKTATVVTSVQDKTAIIEVCDDGPGIAAENRLAVFEPFYRVEASRNRDSGGTGLGLTIVRQILEAHDGTVMLANRHEGGLSVRIALPLAG